MFFKSPKYLGKFVQKLVTNNFQKLPNLVTPVTSLPRCVPLNMTFEKCLFSVNLVLSEINKITSTHRHPSMSR